MDSKKICESGFSIKYSTLDLFFLCLNQKTSIDLTAGVS